MKEDLLKYVYILQSISSPNQYYTGCAHNLKERLEKHNAGSVFHTSKYVPWKFLIFVGFEDHQKADAFEQYLKSGSGREFAKRHFR